MLRRSQSQWSDVYVWNDGAEQVDCESMVGAEFSRRCLVVLEDSTDLVSLYLCILSDNNGSGCRSTYQTLDQCQVYYYYHYYYCCVYLLYVFICCICVFVRVHVRHGICVAISGQHEGFCFLLPPWQCQASGLATSSLTHWVTSTAQNQVLNLKMHHEFLEYSNTSK